MASTWGHAAELLDVDVDELTRSCADIADRHAGETIAMGEPADAVAAEDAVHGRAGIPQERPETVRPNPEAST